MLPPHERLDADHPPGAQVELGLVVQDQFVLGDAPGAALRAARGRRRRRGRAPAGRPAARARTRFAAYMARSARCCRISASSAWSGNSAMPMLASTVTSWSPRSTGCSSAMATRVGDASACGRRRRREQDRELVAAEPGDQRRVAAARAGAGRRRRSAAGPPPGARTGR